MRLLIIEDEEKTRAYLSKGLREAGFAVETAQDAEAGAFALHEGSVDLLICDVMLPGVSGWTLVKRLREAGSSLPVIFLTARDAIEDRVAGLDAGGDDYLVKPFAFSELLARVRAVLRRRTDRSTIVFAAADLTLDPIRHRVRRAETEISLTPREFALLQLLLERKGEVLGRTEIAELVWDLHFDTDTNIVDVAIRRLRQKIDDPSTVKLIHTVRGAGYVLRDP